MRHSAVLSRIAVALGAAVLSFGSTVPVAPAAHARSLEVRIKVDGALAAQGFVGDDLFDGTYSAILTAVGPVLCDAAGPTTVIADRDNSSGNPAEPSTDGTCSGAFSGVVTYQLEWVAVPGTSGHFTRVCAVTLGRVTCTEEGTRVVLPEIHD